MIGFVKRYISKEWDAPLHLTHFVTSRCNARCGHCFYWKSLNKKDELNLNEIKKVCQNMGDVFILILTGGEPFLRKDLHKIAKLYFEHNSIKNLLIPTNGLLPSQIYATTEKILKTCLGLAFTVNISLDGIGKTHDRIRGVDGAFEKAIQTYNLLKKLRGEYKNFKVNFAATVSYYNQDKIMDLYNYVKGTVNAELSLVLTRGLPKKSSACKVDIRYYKEAYKKISDDDESREIGISNCLVDYHSLKRLMRFRMNNIRYKLIADTYENNRYITRCYAGLLNAVIYENGDVFPCELLNKKIGNLRQEGYDFKKLWHSKRAQEIRRWIKKNKCFCTHECYWINNIAFNPKYLIRLLLKDEN